MCAGYRIRRARQAIDRILDGTRHPLDRIDTNASRFICSAKSWTQRQFDPMVIEELFEKALAEPRVAHGLRPICRRLSKSKQMALWRQKLEFSQLQMEVLEQAAKIALDILDRAI